MYDTLFPPPHILLVVCIYMTLKGHCYVPCNHTHTEGQTCNSIRFTCCKVFINTRVQPIKLTYFDNYSLTSFISISFKCMYKWNMHVQIKINLALTKLTNRKSSFMHPLGCFSSNLLYILQAISNRARNTPLLTKHMGA